MRKEKAEGLELIRVFMEQRGSDFVEGVTISSAEIGNKPRPQYSGANSIITVNFVEPLKMRTRGVRAFGEYFKNTSHSTENEPNARLLSTFNRKFESRLKRETEHAADLVVENDTSVTGMTIELREEDIETLSQQIRRTVAFEISQELAAKKAPNFAKRIQSSKHGIFLTSVAVRDHIQEAFVDLFEGTLMKSLTHDQMVAHLTNDQPS